MLDFDSEDNDYEARQVFWHSSAHVMGEACERRFEGCCLGYGPPLPEGGFFYDMSLADGKTLSQDDYKNIEDVAKIAVKEKQSFERLELPKEVLLEMFKVSFPTRCVRRAQADFTVQQVQAALHQRQGSRWNVVHCVPMWTPHRSMSRSPRTPHWPNQVPRIDQGESTTYYIAIIITNRFQNSSSYFLGDAKNDVFQRLYGMSFPDSKRMTEYKKYLEEAAKRDHRRIGREQELFIFHDLSPGSAFFLPLGMRIYNTLLEFMKVSLNIASYMLPLSDRNRASTVNEVSTRVSSIPKFEGDGYLCMIPGKS